MNLKINILIFVIFMILAISGVGTGSLAIIALDPDPYNIPVGHVAFGFQRDDGKFVVGSFGGNGLEGPLIYDDLSEVKNYLLRKSYTTLKAIYVENKNPTAADNTMTALKDSRFVLIESAFPISVEDITSLPDTENCLTFTIKVLRAYGADMPEIIPMITSFPRAYYAGLPWVESRLVYNSPIFLVQGIGTPLLSPTTSGMLTSDSVYSLSQKPFDQLTIESKVSYSYNVPGDWIVTLVVGGIPQDPYTLTLLPDGTVGNGDPGAGKWTLNGNSFRWFMGSTLAGTIDENGKMSGEVFEHYDIPTTRRWYAEKVGGNAVNKLVVTTSVPACVAGVGPLIDEDRNGEGSW